MKTYRVDFKRTTLYDENGYVYVDALSQDEAEQIAVEKIIKNDDVEIDLVDVPWQSYDPTDIEIANVSIQEDL